MKNTYGLCNSYKTSRIRSDSGNAESVKDVFQILGSESAYLH